MHDAQRTCATLLADLDVHPRIAMKILRHAQFSITMENYTQVSSEATRAAMKKLGESLRDSWLLYFAAVHHGKEAIPILGNGL